MRCLLIRQRIELITLIERIEILDAVLNAVRHVGGHCNAPHVPTDVTRLMAAPDA
jgi:hypothetical protein